jgi:hypothetical protein
MAGMNHFSEKKEKGDDDFWVHGQDVGPLSLSAPELLTHLVLPHSLKQGWSRHHLYDTESICEDRSIEAQAFSFFIHWKNLARMGSIGICQVCVDFTLGDLGPP